MNRTGSTCRSIGHLLNGLKAGKKNSSKQLRLDGLRKCEVQQRISQVDLQGDCNWSLTPVLNSKHVFHPVLGHCAHSSSFLKDSLGILSIIILFYFTTISLSGSALQNEIKSCTTILMLTFILASFNNYAILFISKVRRVTSPSHKDIIHIVELCPTVDSPLEGTSEEIQESNALSNFKTQLRTHLHVGYVHNCIL